MGTDSTTAPTKTRKQVLAFIAVSNVPAPRGISFQTWGSGEPGVSVTFDATSDLRAFLAYTLAPDEPVSTWTQKLKGGQVYCASAYCNWGGYRFQLWSQESERDTEPVDDETAEALDAVLDASVEDGHRYECCGKVGRISRHEAWCPTNAAVSA